MTAQSNSKSPMTSLDVRGRLVDALKLDLVGPWRGHELAEERLPGRERPSNWYLTGFLIPAMAPPEQSADADEEDDLSEIPDVAGLAEESNEERKTAKKGFFPSSMGLSFLVSKEARYLDIRVSWGDYALAEVEDKDHKRLSVWQRTPREEIVPFELTGASDMAPVDVPDSEGLQLHVVERSVDTVDMERYLAAGTRSVSVFLVNHREPLDNQPDCAYVFQPEVEVRGETPFVAQPDLRGTQADDWDDQVADLHYTDSPEYATGHGVSAEWGITNGICGVLRTAWIPTAEVEKTETAAIERVELSMDTLGRLATGAEAEIALRPLTEQYRTWIMAQEAEIAALPQERHETAKELTRLANVTADRIGKGIQVLSEDADALDAFRVANRAVARAIRQRLGSESPRWRPFQLAFLLLNLSGLADTHDPHRRTVDLLFFPTGGGKTEAYLGLAAMAMVLRRLRHSNATGLGGAGVSVIMRYTLRLLTLDQLTRAAGLVCALDLEREGNPERYGEWPFEIGLWVGKAATPNLLGHKGDSRPDSARAKVRQFKNNPKGKPSPIPLENCPWCNDPFQSDSFTLLPDDDRPRELRVVCTNFECDFSGDRPLPIIAVDESIYRRLPAFLIATVDKFASLPWAGEAGALFGRGVDSYDQTGFYGPSEKGGDARLVSPLPPPDLVIQDELHLISGPLGTMVGLYETAIEALCSRQVDGQTVRPKIVASTATVRRAQDQIQALFARSETHIFPPPGLKRQDSFFARTVPASKTPARLYVGIAAQGRNPKVIMRRVWLALMGAAERAYREVGGHRNMQNPADPYMTVLGYFNSLRELGGARRLLEEEVQNTIKGYGARRRVGEEHGLFRDRRTFSEVVELTSRVPTNKVAEARRRLESSFHDDQRVDCAIATNMISVGLDIPRLGLMSVLGQPKTHAEYIQATSRVGRDDQRPGLVVTSLNIHKPRDRSHYERFRHYHETFYRSVEVGSVTPFSARALDRGFAGTLVGLARHIEPQLTPSRGVEAIGRVRAALETEILGVFLERIDAQPMHDAVERRERLESIRNRIEDLFDAWLHVVEGYQEVGVSVQYQKYELKQPRPLLREMLEENFESVHHRKFRANRSLRDVEPDVNLFLNEL